MRSQRRQRLFCKDFLLVLIFKASLLVWSSLSRQVRSTQTVFVRLVTFYHIELRLTG